MKFQALLFDFDGTLTPSLPLWVKGFRIALRDYGFEYSDAEIVGRFFYRDWDEIAIELNLGSAEQFRDAIHRGLRRAFHEAELFPEVIELLTQCRAEGRQTALVTSAPKLILDDAIPRLGLHSLFDHIVCADDVRNFKPHPEPVLLALAALNCAARHAIMIGDATADILSGKAAGAATALFIPDEQNSFHNVEALRATEPDYIFARHAELTHILQLDAVSPNSKLRSIDRQ